MVEFYHFNYWFKINDYLIFVKNRLDLTRTTSCTSPQVIRMLFQHCQAMFEIELFEQVRDLASHGYIALN